MLERAETFFLISHLLYPLKPSEERRYHVCRKFNRHPDPIYHPHTRPIGCLLAVLVGTGTGVIWMGVRVWESQWASLGCYVFHLIYTGDGTGKYNDHPPSFIHIHTYRFTITLTLSWRLPEQIWNIIGEDHVQGFVVVGGAALLFHGVVLPIYDTDLAITGDSLNKFYEQAMHDARFTQTLLGAWEYHSSYGFHVEVDFLDKLGQGGYMHELKDHCIIGGIPVATLSDLALGKGGSWKDRDRLKDLLGFEYAVCEMVSKGLDFRRLDSEEKVILEDIMVELPRVGKGRRLLRIITTLL